MMLRPAAPLPDRCSALMPVLTHERGDARPRWCRIGAAIVAAGALALGRTIMPAAVVAAMVAGALLWLGRRLARRRADALAARLAALGDTAVSYRWCRPHPGAIALAEARLVWLVDRSTEYETVRLAPEQIAEVRRVRGWRASRVALYYRLDPHEVARRSLICFGRDRAAADAFAAHLTRR
jgi:hypothetical protein